MVFAVNVVKAVLVRTVLVVHSLLVIWLAATMTLTPWYWLLTMCLFGLVVEGMATVVFNEAQEWKWFCPCFLTYLCSTIPGIWVLELNRMQLYQETLMSVNTTAVRTAAALEGIKDMAIPVEIETDTLVVIMEQLFLYLMILSRWFLPRGEISRDELSQLLFVFIGIASDITELFALFEEDQVRQSTNLTYAILCVWTFSLLQFTFVLTSTHNPQDPTYHRHGKEDHIEPGEEPDSCIKRMFQTEVWSICVNFMLQDGPFLAIRLYTMVEFGVLTYSIIFFTAKNGLLVMLTVYRLGVLISEWRHSHTKVAGSILSEDSRESLKYISTGAAQLKDNRTSNGSLNASLVSRSSRDFENTSLVNDVSA